MTDTKHAGTPSESFWVVERFENDKSAGYWDGANSRSFLSDIDKAIQFHRKCDAFWATRGWRWQDTKITEHVYMAEQSDSALAEENALLKKAMESQLDAMNRILYHYEFGLPTKAKQAMEQMRLMAKAALEVKP